MLLQAVLHPVDPDNGRDAEGDAFDAVFSLERAGDRCDGQPLVKDRVRDGTDAGGDAVVRLALSRDDVCSHVTDVVIEHILLALAPGEAYVLAVFVHRNACDGKP